MDTPFPEREAVERSYRMSADYHKLYQDILAYCREYVSTEGMAEQRQRVCAVSSPVPWRPGRRWRTASRRLPGVETESCPTKHLASN